MLLRGAFQWKINAFYREKQLINQQSTRIFQIISQLIVITSRVISTTIEIVGIRFEVVEIIIEVEFRLPAEIVLKSLL